MTGLPIDVNPEDVAVEMLKAALPGFESRIVPGRDSIGIRGALPIAAELSREMVWYPVYGSPVFVDAKARAMYDAIEPDDMRAARHERQREALRHELAPVIGHIVENVQRFAIEAVGLEALIEEKKAKAFIDGKHAGIAEGHEAGKREGFEDAMRLIVRTLLTSDASFGEAVDRIRREWNADDE